MDVVEDFGFGDNVIKENIEELTDKCNLCSSRIKLKTLNHNKILIKCRSKKCSNSIEGHELILTICKWNKKQRGIIHDR